MPAAVAQWWYLAKLPADVDDHRHIERLGSVGATIVSEVFVGLVYGDHQSYLWAEGNRLEARTAVSKGRNVPND
jgi:hypothetical protein